MAGIRRNNFFILFIIYFLFFTTFGGCSSHSQEIRKPAVSGEFYPADKKSLKEMIDGLLAKTEGEEKNAGGTQIIALIVPHAGYIYSGGVAACAYKLLKGKKIKTVILIGPSHYAAFEGVSVYPEGWWETPLGRVPIDKDAADFLMKKCEFVKSFFPAHQKEHSLEVQLPFLQTVLKDFKIVPLVIGNLYFDRIEVLAQAIVSIVKSRSSPVLVVASSDMSHYHSYGKACLMDGMAIKDIEELDAYKLWNDINKGLCELCGSGPVMTVLEVAKKLNANLKVLKYANSGDVTGDRDRVVGYTSVVFYLGEKDNSSLSNTTGTEQTLVLQKKGAPMLNKLQQEKLLKIARQTLEEYVRKNKVSEFKETDPVLTQKCGAFVTLTKKGQLRGCIGYIQPVLPLYETISKMAIESSTGDPRFSPVSPEELKDIHIEISVLTPLEQIHDFNKIEVGRHGLYIHKGFYSGLLLPQVATSYGWDKWQFLDQTCAKAGLPPGSWKDKDAQVFIFSAQIFGEENK